MMTSYGVAAGGKSARDSSRVRALVFLLLAATIGHAQDLFNGDASIRVSTGDGPIVGIRGAKIQSFRGIPYAAPPVADLRFRPPVEPRNWTRAKSARLRTPACPQVLDLDDPAEDGEAVTSEDCLTLNVWTPGADAADRPVMVFIHGGGLTEGSAADSWYDGAYLAERGNVVVVSLQYRLGALGFLELAEIGGPSVAQSGNLGILDQILALRWVQKNIGAFGGDPRNVTIFGESAGGASIHGLLAIPEARDLFQKAIIESGDPGQFLSEARAGEIAKEFMALAHTKTLADLRHLSVEQMMRAQSEIFKKGYAMAVFCMVQDGITFKTTPIEAVSADPSLSKPLLIGTNAEEMRSWIALDDIATDRQPESVLRDRLAHIFGSRGPGVLDAYLGNNNTYSEAVINLVGDVVFRMPSIRLAEANSQRQPTYMYLFNYRSLTRGPTGVEYGAMHGLEVAFVFHVDSSMGYSYVGPKGSWTHLSDQMVAAWTSFARTGNPNTALLPPWPAYDESTRATMTFDTHSHVSLDPYGQERRAWDGVASEKFEDGEAVRLTDPIVAPP